MKLPSYLRLSKHNIYIYRRRIPVDVLSHFKTGEIRSSLNESRKKTAIQKAYKLTVECEALFFCLRNSLPMKKELPKPLADIVKQKQELMIKDERLEEAKAREFALHQKILAERKASNQMLEISQQTAALAIQTAFRPKGRLITLNELIVEYFDGIELKRREDSIATIRKDRDALKRFSEIVGNKLISDINQSDAAKFAKEIATYALTPGKQRQIATINGYLNCVGKFSSWVATFHSDTNHVKLDFSRLRRKKRVKASEEKEAFSDEEALNVFRYLELTEIRFKDPAVYWVIYIAAYSGARLEEIAQLDPTTDIYQKDSIWLFDINDSENKQLKNLSSKRLVPIHSKLIELGLIDYIEQLKKDKSLNLLPDENVRDGRIGKNVGKRISRLIKIKAGVLNKSLHSFRHAFVTKLKRLGVQESFAASLVGHENGGISYGRYGKGFTPAQLKDVVELVNFN